MAKVAKKNQTFYDSLTHALFQSFEGVTRAIDKTIESREVPSADTGHEKPSTKDISLQIEIGQVLSYHHRQINGPIVTKTGTYPCLKEMILKNEKKIAEIQGELEDPNLSSAGQVSLVRELDTQIRYLEINEAKIEHSVQMFNAYVTVWNNIFNRKWEPPMQQAPTTSILKDMSATEAEEAKKAALERLAAYNKRKAS